MTFRAYLIEQADGKVRSGFADMQEEQLDAGEVKIAVAYSSVNYKDALAATGAGRIIRRFPCVGGIDMAGTVLESVDARFKPGDEVIATSYDIGVAHHGGYAERARIPAFAMERMLRDWTYKYPWNMEEEVRLGRLPASYLASGDPKRLVPIVWDAEDYMVMVTGDELRNSAYILAHQGSLGYPVAREIRLPGNWSALRAEDEARRQALLAGT